MRKLKAADLFCGAGGTSLGAKQSGAVDVIFALNHWETAVKTHFANFPNAKHVNSRLDQTDPSECDPIDLLFASPSCTHHSRARGGKPTNDQQRADAWDVMRWLEHHRPSYMVIENVWEFTQWGPVNTKTGKPIPSLKGKFFDAWLMAIRAAGYKLDYRKLNAADFEARTSRERFFLIARKGNRSPLWPEPTRCEFPVKNALPGMGLPGWLPAADAIDWSIPCPSIFSRNKQLADNTLLRLEAGLRKFVAPFVLATGSGGAPRYVWQPAPTIVTNDNTYLCQPFVTQWDNTSNKGACSRSVDDPLPTMLTKANMGIAMPYGVTLRNNADANSLNDPLGTLTAGGRHHGVAMPYLVPHFGEREGQTPRTHDLGKAMPAITGQGAGSLAMPFMMDANHKAQHDDDHNRRLHDLQNPVGSLTTENGKAIAVPWIPAYYGSDTQNGIDDPMATIPTHDRHALAVAIYSGPDQWPAPKTDAMQKLQNTMRELGVCDLGYRMLQNHELAFAQGFPKDYIFMGNKKEVTKQIGNSVSPPVAKAISLAIAG